MGYIYKCNITQNSVSHRETYLLVSATVTNTDAAFVFKNNNTFDTKQKHQNKIKNLKKIKERDKKV